MKAVAWVGGGLIVALFSLILPRVILASEVLDAELWAEAWLEASNNLEFQGSFVRRNAIQNQSERYHFWQMEHDGQRQQRMRVDGGTVLEVIRIGDQLSCWHGPDAQVPADHELPSFPFSDILQAEPERLQQNYRLTRLDETSISDRPVDRYRLDPRALTELYSHEVWIDRETRLILAHRIMDGDELLQETRFESLQFGELRMPISWSRIHPASFWHRYESSPARMATTGGWTEYTDRMPESFSLAVDESQPGQLYQLWSDGLVRVSLMLDDVNPDKSDALFNTMERRGAQSLVGRAINGRQLVVAGLIPPRVAEQIVEEFEQ